MSRSTEKHKELQERAVDKLHDAFIAVADAYNAWPISRGSEDILEQLEIAEMIDELRTADNGRVIRNLSNIIEDASRILSSITYNQHYALPRLRREVAELNELESQS